ncbi:uncharacterized protein B0J16DRAFT_327999 [Fusarium flagelliforme]|uniref:uncharacterized protein n=1 Tax=Fusarium flagelliforme TaxID=2675880 RepID=UPI001E8D7124|nr:uncharacterized protein B0J16DRAFT_327999 [Fusarium flagelliforme]KAH7197359.1 hypothetical protein B0J16DRAFT_327999 [Fusarium flagelliforme]
MFFYRQASSLEALSWWVAIMHGNAVSALVILYASRGLIICVGAGLYILQQQAGYGRTAFKDWAYSYSVPRLYSKIGEATISTALKPCNTTAQQ